MVGLDKNRWRIKLFTPKNSFKKIGEGVVDKKIRNIKTSQNSSYMRKRDHNYLQLPNVKQNKFS